MTKFRDLNKLLKNVKISKATVLLQSYIVLTHKLRRLFITRPQCMKYIFDISERWMRTGVY